MLLDNYPALVDRVMQSARSDGTWAHIEVETWRHIQSGSVGLGDFVHSVAQPIARALDGIAGTKLQTCGGCAKRRDVLNRIKL